LTLKYFVISHISRSIYICIVVSVLINSYLLSFKSFCERSYCELWWIILASETILINEVHYQW